MDEILTRLLPPMSGKLLRIIVAVLLAQCTALMTACPQSLTWKPCGQTLFGKSIYSLKLCSSGTILAGASNGDIFRSTDEGRSWTRVRKGIRPFDILKPEDNKVQTFAETHDGHIFAGTDQGELVASVDDGRTWTRVSTEPYELEIRDILVTATGDLFLASRNYGVLRAIRDKDGWKPLELVLERRPMLSLASRSREIIAGTFQAGAFRSTDNGESWKSLQSGLVVNGWHQSLTSMVVNPLNEIVGVSSQFIYYLKPGDTTWVRTTNGQFRLEKITQKGARIAGLSYAPVPPTTFAQTVGGSRNWIPVSQAGLKKDYFRRAITFTPSDNLLIGGDAYGIYGSTNNGKSWEPMNRGLTNAYVVCLGWDETTNAVYAGTLHEGIYKSDDEGESWVQMGLSTTPILGTGAKGYYVFVLRGASPADFKPKPGLWRSDDGGKTWSDFSPGLERCTRGSLALGKGGQILLGTDAEGVYFSSNNAESWERRNAGLASERTNQVILGKGNEAYAATPSGVYRFTNGGKKWDLAGLKNIECTALALGTKNRLFVGTDSSGMYSLDVRKGHWTIVGFPQKSVTFLAIDAKGNIIAGGMDHGVFRSTDGAKSWFRVADGIPDHLTIPSILTTGNATYVSSLGDGIFKISLGKGTAGSKADGRKK